MFPKWRQAIATIILAAIIVGVLYLDNVSSGTMPPLPVGMNLSGPEDWGAEWPFVNIMKYSRKWITHNSEYISGGMNEWDTGVLDQIPLDEHGYPLGLPVNVPDTECAQIVRTVWANTATLQEGFYTVLYEGVGVLDFWGDAEIVSQEPGRVYIYITPGDCNLFALEIQQSVPGNHVRNIRVLMPGTEDIYEIKPWSEDWLEKLKLFKTIRFMDWGYTNNSELQHWEDRPQLDDYTYTLHGVPYEWMIELCNLKQADAWIDVPHLADDNYIRSMAQLFRDNMDPGLKIYVEYSNELWNWMFDQTHYCLENGDQSKEWPERIVPFIQNVMDIWTQEFAGQMDRIVRVVGVQTACQDVSNRIVFNMAPGSFDAFAPAAYFGLTSEAWDALETLGENATAEDVLYWARVGMLTDSFPALQLQKATIADSLHIPMLYYECGQHITPNPFGSEQPYNQALMDAQTNPGMYDLYTKWFDCLRTLITISDEALMMNFSFISSKNGRYGCWGALENQFTQSPPYLGIAPKYQALLDYIALNSMQLPVADFSAEPIIGTAPLTVAFTDFSTPGDGLLVDWQWNFGDGDILSYTSPTYIYTESGLYTVSLEVTDEYMLSGVETKIEYITVTGVTADFTLDTASGYHPLIVQFQDQSLGYGTEVVGWNWDFGDGKSDIVQNPVHTYDEPGTYYATLTVIGAYGDTDFITCPDPVVVEVSSIFADSFDIESTGSVLPLPWESVLDDSWTVGATVADNGLTWNGQPVSGNAATFPSEREESYQENAFSINIGPGGNKTVTLYLSAMIQPDIDPDNGWGDQPVCFGLYNSNDQYKSGVWLGMVQNLQSGSPDFKKDYFAVGLCARPSYGFSNAKVATYSLFGQPESGQTYYLLGKFQILNNATGADSIHVFLNIYEPGESLPESEPEDWEFMAVDAVQWPLTCGNYILDSIYLHRDNTSNNAVLDDVKVAYTFECVKR